MRKKWLAILSLFIVLTLSGCLEISQEIWHNPDGSGRVVIEMILSEEMLSFMDIGGGPEANREEILRELDISPEEISADDPNVRSASVDSYYDPDQAKFHIVMDIELYDLVKGLPVDEDTDMVGLEFQITDNNDGTYRFSQTANMDSEMGDGELDQASFAMIEAFMAGDMYTLKLHVEELIEAEPNAVYDQKDKVLVWEIPMVDMMTGSAPSEFWAVYRVDSSSFMPSLDMGGLPNWAPFVLVGLCCVTLLAVIIIVVVIVLIARKRKQETEVV